MGGNDGGELHEWLATVNIDIHEQTKQLFANNLSLAKKSDVRTFFNSLIANLFVDSETLAHIGRLFQVIDTNKSGSVDREEFR